MSQSVHHHIRAQSLDKKVVTMGVFAKDPQDIATCSPGRITTLQQSTTVYSFRTPSSTPAVICQRNLIVKRKTDGDRQWTSTFCSHKGAHDQKTSPVRRCRTKVTRDNIDSTNSRGGQIGPVRRLRRHRAGLSYRTSNFEQTLRRSASFLQFRRQAHVHSPQSSHRRAKFVHGLRRITILHAITRNSGAMTRFWRA